jgi:NAD(P)-dependent dehydrogenase (short-subunit alcohol dehydrogenase family)
MELGIQGKRALVTAASRGIGREIAKHLAEEGVMVAVCGRTQNDIDSLVDEMGGADKGHFGLVLDLEPEGSVQTLMGELNAHFGDVDIVVHNLGSTLEIRDPLCSVEDWRRIWRINVEVAIELNIYLIPKMQERDWGRVVHIASTASIENNGPITYCTAKAALAAYSRSFGRVLAESNVVMSAVLPGAVYTEGGSWELAEKERPEHVKSYLEQRCPAKRFGTEREISPMVLLLCSELATFCQGGIMPVDGGQIRSYIV